ncbi:MAG: hypothetical protein KAJ19_18065 [Gammaproteobacteria bacterium]|nr:hypothetical protein [Gammaproteobacteria bacterium]
MTVISPFPSFFNRLGAINLSESSFSPTGEEGGDYPSDDNFNISNEGVKTLNWTITKNEDWLSVAPDNGSTDKAPDSDNVVVSYDTTGLDSTTAIYNDIITVTDENASNSPQTIAVELTITAPPEGAWFGCDAEPASGEGNSTANYTYIFHESCPIAGNITKIEIYVGNESAGVLDFAVFTGAGGAGSYTDTHSELALPISNGLNQYYDGVDFDKADLPIEIGEWIGAYITSSGIWRKKTSGGPGYLYDSGDQISGTPAASTFSLSGNSSHEMQIRVWIE